MSNKQQTIGFLKSLFLVFLLGLASNFPVSAAYQLTDLGENVSPTDVNDSGTVVGSRSYGAYPGLVTVAFRWTSTGGIENLDGRIANAINDSGQIVGNTTTGAFLLDNNNYKNWTDQGAYGINDSGNISGNKAGKNPYRETSIPYNPAVYEGNKWAVIDIAKVYPRGTRQGVYADIYTLSDLNEAGFAVGKKRRYGLAGSSAIMIAPPYSGIHDSTDVTYLSAGVAAAINNQGIVVGATQSNSRTDTYAFAFLYQNNLITNLGTLGGLTSSAGDINEGRQVVGTAATADAGNHAFIWDDKNGMVDLNDTIQAGTGWVLSSASAINELGDIAGRGTLNGVSHGFLLTNGTIPPAPNQQPVSIANSDITAGKAPLVVNFTGAESYDPDPDDTITYEWDFGDSTGSTEMIPAEHTYNNPGNYVVTLTVTDDQGSFHIDQLEITVRKSGGKK